MMKGEVLTAAAASVKAAVLRLPLLWRTGLAAADNDAII